MSGIQIHWNASRGMKWLIREANDFDRPYRMMSTDVKLAALLNSIRKAIYLYGFSRQQRHTEVPFTFHEVLQVLAFLKQR